MPKTDRKAKKGQIARVKPSDISGLPAAYFCYVLGSGGHTTEMMELIRKTLRPSKNVHRRYIFTTGDRNSLVAMTSFEQRVTEVYGEDAGTWDAYQITRARKVHQPLWTTWLTSLLSALSALEALMTLPDAEIRPDPQDRKCFQYPHVITTNGPGTGIIVSLVAHLLKIFWARNCMKVVFIETWAHVRTLSLTGKLFHWTRIPDVYLVQHEPLAERYGYPLFEFVTLPRPIRPDVTGSNHASQSPHSPAIGASLLGGPAASTAVMSPEHSSCEDSSSMSPPSSPTGATCNSSVHEGSSDQG
jgi:beta-1,4-N-acetylglucosaminyltransferase